MRLVEAMHFVDEQYRTPALALCHLGRDHRLAYVLDATQYGGNRQELGVETVRHQPGQCRLADTRRAPEDHRMRPARLEGHPQRLARCQQVGLTHDIVQAAGSHALGQRRVAQVTGRRREQIVIACHAGDYCILTTSTPDDAVKAKASAGRPGLTWISVSSMRVVCPKASRISNRTGMLLRRPMSTWVKPASAVSGSARSQRRPSASGNADIENASSSEPEPNKIAAGEAPID